MKRLSVAQREAVRHFADSADPKGIAARTRDSLVRLGLLVQIGDRGGYSLTPRGLDEYRRIMASGDGPEALKELFSVRRR